MFVYRLGLHLHCDRDVDWYSDRGRASEGCGREALQRAHHIHWRVARRWYRRTSRGGRRWLGAGG